MKNGTTFREFTKYTFSNVMGMVAISCYILADTFFVAKATGSTGLAALNLAIPIYGLIFGIGIMNAIGGSIRFAICKGRKDGQKGSEAFTLSFIIWFIFSIIFFLMGVFISEELVTLFGANKEAFYMTNVYVKVILLFAPCFMLNTLFQYFVKNDGNPALTMAAMIISNAGNIILDYIFIFPMKMGMLGAALGTGLSPVIALIVFAPFFIKKKNTFHLVKFRVRWSDILDTANKGLPLFISEITTGFIMLVFNNIMLGLGGNVAIAAYGIIANISLVVMSIYNGIGQGIQPIVSRSYGEDNMDKVYDVLIYALRTMLIIAGIVYAIMFFAGEGIAAIFNGERNMMLQRLAVDGLKYYFLSTAFVGFNIIIGVYFASVEREFESQIVSILRGFVVILPVVVIMSKCFGIAGVFLAIPVAEMIVAIISTVLYKRKSKYKLEGGR